jgi:23S rRNA pseudouridine1911/1915/1917 synthase
MEILFEDEWMLAINKPAGVVVNRAESVKELTVQDWVEKQYGSLFQGLGMEADRVFRERSGICHRLDKETSGVLLIAKDSIRLMRVMEQFKLRQIKKEYIALCHGLITPETGWFYLPIKRKMARVRKFGVDPLGKEAYTGYRVEKQFKNASGAFTLVRLFPCTGRTHQIRVHLSHYHFPIVADHLYASEKQFHADMVWCGRHFLHAEKIEFSHPYTGIRMSLSCPLPRDLTQALAYLEEGKGFDGRV